jgi:hypothetical protein
MMIISGGQSGADRAALDAAIERGLPWGGWCPKGGWAEDFPTPPGLLARYPRLRETPLGDPAQRTEWNVRDSDAILIIVMAGGVAVSPGTMAASRHAVSGHRPVVVADAGDPDAVAQVAAWLEAQHDRFGLDMKLGVGGPRESEAAGTYRSAGVFLRRVLPAAGPAR